MRPSARARPSSTPSALSTTPCSSRPGRTRRTSRERTENRSNRSCTLRCVQLTYLPRAKAEPSLLGPQDWPYLAYSTSQFALYSLLSLRLSSPFQSQSTPVPTLDSADFLFLNIDTYQLAHCCASCPASAALPKTLDRHTIRRAVTAWLTAFLATHGDRRTSYPSLVLSLALIDHDYEGNILRDDSEKHLRSKVVVVGIERAPWESEDRLDWFEGAPYPSAFHLPPEPGAQEKARNWLSTRDRKYLSVAFLLLKSDTHS